MIEELQEAFSNQDPELSQMLAFQDKINEIIRVLNKFSQEHDDVMLKGKL